jgi:hypothetical protein
MKWPDLGGVVTKVTEVFTPRVERRAATISDPDTDGTLWQIGPPGWIWIALFLSLELVAHWKAIAGNAEALTYLDKLGGTVNALLGILMGSLLGYRGWRGHLKKQVIEAQAKAKAQVDSATATGQNPPPAPSTKTTVTTETPA